MNFLQAKKYYIHIEVEQAKFTYSPLGKANLACSTSISLLILL